MAKAGNHGQLILRDRELLYNLYWEEMLTLTEIGKIYNVTHKSISRVFNDLNIPIRTKGNGYQKLCVDCGEKPVVKIPHKLTKGGCGRRCKECQRKHKQNLTSRYWQKIKDSPEVMKKRRTQSRKFYYSDKGIKQNILKFKASDNVPDDLIQLKKEHLKLTRLIRNEKS